MLSQSICKKSLNEILEISYENPPYLTPREFTLSVIATSNIIGKIPYGFSIGLAIVAKHFITENNLNNYSIYDQVNMFTNDIKSFFSSYKNKPEDALEGLISYIHMEATGKFIIGGEIGLAIDNCISAGEHFEWYQAEAIKVGLLTRN